MDRLTNSRLVTFRSCPRKHFLRYEVGLVPEKDSDALRIGTAYHAAHEAKDRGLDPVAALQDLGTLDEHEQAIVWAMFECHRERWSQSDRVELLAIGIEFDIVAQWDGSQWIDWTLYDAQVWGDWFVVMKDGKPNEKPVLQLATSLGWFGGLRDILDAPPPRKVVQLTVKPDTYQGTTRHKATWMDPEDADPNAAGEQGPSPEKVSVLDAKIGSQLRALAGKAARKPVDDIPF